MVMHARKHPRLNDGHGDKKDAHLYQSMRYPSKTLSDPINDCYDKLRSSLEDNRSRDDSPGGRHSPRYQNKASYIERTKEKLERGSTDSPPTDRKFNHHTLNSNNRGSGSNHQNHDNRSHKNDKDIKEQKEKDHRAEVQKSAVRVCGDWSEHISSSGKKYYYNCKTEVSQWERPREWVDISSKSNDGKLHDNRIPIRQHTHSCTKSTDEKIKHSMGGEKTEKYNKITLLHSSSKSLDRQLLQDKYKTTQSKDLLDVVAQRTSQWVHKGGQLQEIANKDNYRKENVLYHNFLDNSGIRRHRHDSEGSRSFGPSTPRKLDDSKHNEDADISPGSTPTNSRINSRTSCTGTPHLLSGHTSLSTVGSSTATLVNATGPSVSTSSNSAHNLAGLPQLISQWEGEKNQELTQKALQTLQKLQEAISRQLSMSAQNTNQSSRIPVPQSDTSPQHSLKSPTLSTDSSQNHPVNLQAVPDEERDRHSLHSERSGRSGSPTPSTASSRDIPVGPLSAIGVKKETSVSLPQSLSNYCNDKLIGHVQGWQTDHAERQANRYWEEGLTIGSLDCSQVSVDLKRARSLVRIAEIQSTLHEQRILSLAQQIRELESMKSYPSSYMSSD